MAVVKDLKKYFSELPDSMRLKKKIIKCIMKATEPLSQKEIKELADDADWTNIRRVLKELLDEGLIVKERKGTVDYYVKVEYHGKHERLEDGEIVYFMDEFHPDFKGDEEYVRIKQAIQKDKDTFETLGKITVKVSSITRLIDTLKKLKKEEKS